MRYRFLRFPGGLPKAVTFSYDDGVKADIKLSEILCEYGIKCAFNLNSAWFGMGTHLTTDEIKEHLIDKGHEIAVHGHQHIANGKARAIEGIRDVLDCRLSLEAAFGGIIRGMAYPDTGVSCFHNGTSMEDISAYLKSLDIVYARALGEKNHSLDLPTDWYRWYPTAHHNDEDIFNLIDAFLKSNPNEGYIAGRGPKLFYLWGHSYEFDQKDNWDRIEKICKELGNKADTWYPTNIELYEYTEAYSRLVFSADSKTVYNPTLKEIWFEADCVTYSVKPGETIQI